MARVLVFAVCLGASLSVCTAVWAQRATGVSGAIAQPFRDLGLLRPRPEDVLRQAAAAPYAVPTAEPNNPLYCSAIDGELVSLDVALGSDVDVHNQRRRTAGSMASGALSNAIGDVVGLPYRSVIRRISGAERRDRQVQTAIQAGMVRRAFLKGLRVRDCDASHHAPVQQMAATTLADVTPVSDTAFTTPQSAQDAAPLQTPAPHAPVLQAAAEHHAAPPPTGGALQTVADVTPAG